MAPKPFESDFSKLVKEALTEQGITVKDGVVEQLVNFCYSFTTQLAQSAQDIVGSAEALTPETIILANELRKSHSEPLSVKEFGELAQEVNTIPLLSVADRPGLKLPMEDDCLLAPNYQVCTKDESDAAHLPNVSGGSMEVTEEELMSLLEGQQGSPTSENDSLDSNDSKAGPSISIEGGKVPPWETGSLLLQSEKDTIQGKDTSAMDSKESSLHDAALSSDFLNSGFPMGHVPHTGAEIIQKDKHVGVKGPCPEGLMTIDHTTSGIDSLGGITRTNTDISD